MYFIFTLSGEQLLLEEQDHTRTMLRNIQSLAEDLYRNEITNLKNEKIPQPPEGAMSRIHQPIFPHLESAVVQDIIDEGLAIQMKEKSAFWQHDTMVSHYRDQVYSLWDMIGKETTYTFFYHRIIQY